MISLYFVTVYFSWACAIPDEDTVNVIITGGYYTRNTVSVYSVEGWHWDLPPLNTGRYNHACSSYWSGERRVRKYEGVMKITF